MVWVAEKPFGYFLTLLWHFILQTKHGYSSMVSLLLDDLLLHRGLHHSTPLWPQERIVWISAGESPDIGYVIEHKNILLPFIHEPHCDHFLHSSSNYSLVTVANSKHVCIHLEQPPLWTWIYGTAQLENCLAGKSVVIEYYDIVDDEIDLWWP